MLADADIKNWIEKGLPESQAEVTGDGHHFEATVICPHFEGKTVIEQHRMVYDALGDKMQNAIHALAVKTLTPEQLANDDQ